MPDAVSGYWNGIRNPPWWRPACLPLVLVMMLAAGCACTTPTDHIGPFPTEKEPVAQVLRVGIQPWMGTPHRLGGMSHRGIDCSGLVVVLFNDLFNIQLPRTTSALIHTGLGVERQYLSPGDLVFFRPGIKYRHVGIYLGNGEFVHASTGCGVMISRMDDDPWSRSYLTGRRLL